MKTKRYLMTTAFLILLISLSGYSQELRLKSINSPGEISITEIPENIVFENIRGPVQLLFLGNEMNLKKKEPGKKTFRRRSQSEDILQTSYSGIIFSRGINNPIIFENKTQEELNLLYIQIFPKILEMPYTINIKLTVKIQSKSINSRLSDNAGEYRGKIIIQLKNLRYEN